MFIHLPQRLLCVVPAEFFFELGVIGTCIVKYIFIDRKLGQNCNDFEKCCHFIVTCCLFFVEIHVQIS